jgi:hypothetical protein
VELRVQALPCPVPNALGTTGRAIRRSPSTTPFHEVTARRIRCIGSGCVGRVLGPLDLSPGSRMRGRDAMTRLLMVGARRFPLG